jgi:transposase
VYGNRARLRSGIGQEALALRAAKVERSFALVLDRGGLRRTRLRGRENVRKRYLVHVAGYNLGLVMRQLIGAGTPNELVARGARLPWLLDPDLGLPVLFILPPEARPEPTSPTDC